MTNSDKENKKLPAELTSQFMSMNGWQRGQTLLTVGFGDIGEKRIDQIKLGIESMIGWHDKQHPKSETCEYCELAQQHVVMYQLIKLYFQMFGETLMANPKK